MSHQIKKVAVIGAGIAGISCARELQDAGFSVTVFDKNKGIGGRMSHRQFEQWGIDDGAQYFTAKTPLFQQALQIWQAAKVVEPWNGTIVLIQGQSQKTIDNQNKRFVCVPTMNSLSEFLADKIVIKTNHKIFKINHTDRGWNLYSRERGHHPDCFDYVVIAIPSQQAANLLADTTPRLQNICSSVRMLPCWTLITYFESPLTIPFDGAFLDGSIFSWIARDNSKPSRPNAEAWVAQANPEWSMEHIDDNNYQVEPDLVHHFERLIGRSCTLYQSHLWRYALVENPLECDFELDKKLQLALCGDWFIQSTVEGAWTSGYLLAQAIKQC
jgi:renalase